jgi:hypothetical protein
VVSRENEAGCVAQIISARSAIRVAANRRTGGRNARLASEHRSQGAIGVWHFRDSAALRSARIPARKRNVFATVCATCGACFAALLGS